jgi:hypothetical protein
MTEGTKKTLRNSGQRPVTLYVNSVFRPEVTHLPIQYTPSAGMAAHDGAPGMVSSCVMPRRLSRTRLVLLFTLAVLGVALAALHLSYPLPYVYAVVVDQGPDYDDIHQFPARAITPSDSPEELTVSIDPVSPRYSSSTRTWSYLALCCWSRGEAERSVSTSCSEPLPPWLAGA